MLKKLSLAIASMSLSASICGTIATAGAGLDMHALALDLGSFPAGGVVLQENVDKTAAAVNAEGVLGTSSTQGTTYASYHFLGTLVEKVRLPRYNGASRVVWLAATLFPSNSLAQQAFLSDTNLNQCDVSPVINLAITMQTCAYNTVKYQEAGMYAIGVIGSVEFVVLGFVEEGSLTARARAIRDVSYVARQEGLHIMHVLMLTPASSRAASTPVPHGTATRVNTATPAATPTPADTATSVAAPSSPSSQSPSRSNARCPHTLQNKDWRPVNLRPDLYVGCMVDVAAQVYGTQSLDSAVEYNAHLNPDQGPDWTVFAQDYSDTPPTIPDNTWARIKGIIDASTGAYNALGSYQGNVPEVRILSIAIITEAQARRMGADVAK